MLIQRLAGDLFDKSDEALGCFLDVVVLRNGVNMTQTQTKNRVCISPNTISPPHVWLLA